ncbi:two-component system sensor histidine kinase NtrB [Radiobacillus deserti]|uniref:histidine kinase n=1 Tax=Radiobacillus deserti TaxID=2594883 RepID=A0A516KJ57_9BACI|nr:ATP-binding protein [Radiobacillus deserti]QDP41428.1 hypothetical protein FN924_15305 [Radiobacillus deserti]
MQLAHKTIKFIPFPFFVIDEEFQILEVSEKSMEQFPTVHSFLDLVDLSSRKKAERFMNPVVSRNKVELNLITKHQSLLLFDVYTQWENQERLFVFCVEKQESIQAIRSIIHKLEKQLENDDLSLQEKQEQLEMTIRNMQQVVIHHDNLSNIGKIASSIAEDLKKPLISVRGFLQLLKPYLVELGKDHYADIALDEIDHANNLIYQFLDATNISLPQKEQVNIQKLLMDVVEKSEAAAYSVNTEIKYMKEQILPVMNIDRKQIKQVLLNLIQNAMESIKVSANKDNGNVVIRTELTEKTIEISVRDNGIGMDRDTVKRIFTPFYTTKRKGTGIGLALSLKIIENHGGLIDVFSEPDQGSTFVVVLPLDE